MYKPYKSRTRRSKSQRLRRKREFEAQRELFKSQQLAFDRLGHHSGNMPSVGSMSTGNMQTLQQPGNNPNILEFLKNFKCVVVEQPLIKKEIIDPSEQNQESILLDNAADPLSFVETEVKDSSKASEKLILPEIKTEPTEIDNNTNKPSRTERLPQSTISERDILEIYPTIHSVLASEGPFIPHLPEGYDYASSQRKKKLGPDCQNKAIKKEGSYINKPILTANKPSRTEEPIEKFTNYVRKDILLFKKHKLTRCSVLLEDCLVPENLVSISKKFRYTKINTEIPKTSNSFPLCTKTPFFPHISEEYKKMASVAKIRKQRPYQVFKKKKEHPQLRLKPKYSCHCYNAIMMMEGEFDGNSFESTQQLCSCLTTDSETLKPVDALIEEVSLFDPEFGKITCGINKPDYIF